MKKGCLIILLLTSITGVSGCKGNTPDESLDLREEAKANLEDIKAKQKDQICFDDTFYFSHVKTNKTDENGNGKFEITEISDRLIISPSLMFYGQYHDETINSLPLEEKTAHEFWYIRPIHGKDQYFHGWKHWGKLKKEESLGEQQEDLKEPDEGLIGEYETAPANKEQIEDFFGVVPEDVFDKDWQDKVTGTNYFAKISALLEYEKCKVETERGTVQAELTITKSDGVQILQSGGWEDYCFSSYSLKTVKPNGAYTEEKYTCQTDLSLMYPELWNFKEILPEEGSVNNENN